MDGPIDDSEKRREKETTNLNSSRFSEQRDGNVNVGFTHVSSTVQGRPVDAGLNMAATDVATITDYSPEWSYTEGGVKVLVSGPWYLSGHNYYCAFGREVVPATLIQTGVLRCFCPPHPCGNVQLRVSCEGQLISNGVIFTYKEKEKGSRSSLREENSETSQQQLTKDQRFVLRLLERFENMENFLENPAGNSGIQQQRCGDRSGPIPQGIRDFEERFVRICDRMSRLEWQEDVNLPDIVQQPSRDDFSHHCGMKLLHFAAALGFSRLIAALLRWRAEKPSAILSEEVDPVLRDGFGRTPLFLACENGRIGSARLLAEYNQLALRIPNSDGICPLKAARTQGHKSLVENLVLWAYNKDRREGESVRAEQNKEEFGTLRRGSVAREIIKRTSVEGLESLLRQAAGESVGSTEAKVTRQNDQSDASDREPSPLSVEIPMDVEAPESPQMLHMWQQVTSPGVVAGEDARAQMATLAQQIIDALPDRIKQEGVPEENNMDLLNVILLDDHNNMNSRHSYEQFLTAQGSEDCAQMSRQQLLSPVLNRNNNSDFLTLRFCDRATPSTSAHSPGGSSASALHSPRIPQQQFVDGAGHSPLGIILKLRDTFRQFLRDMDDPLATSSPQTQVAGCCVDSDGSMSTSELGAFFNAYRLRNSPLERHFQDLALNDREQRELYEAAKIIQTAFRQYKARVACQKNQKQLESERHAAIVIQSYYRRYKQYCYFKKLHRAALLIQKHFRLHRASKEIRGSGRSWKSSAASCSGGFSGSQDEEEFWEFAAAAAAAEADSDSCFRMKVNPEELVQWQKHLAAVRIQHAFRGHYMRKRQAAARKIQKFMRESRQKLQMARNSDAVEEIQVPAEHQ